MTDQRLAGARLKELEAENRRLRKRLADAESQVELLQGALDEVRAQNVTLAGKVLDLEARLGANSGNSSKPPSSDGPEAARPKQRGGAGSKKRKRGGQPGHPSTARATILPEHADSQETIVPERCECCNAELSGHDPTPIGRPLFEIPRPTIRLTWYWLHELQCTDCGQRTRARAPGAVGQSLYGANIHALLALMVTRFRQSKRLASELFEVLYGLRIPASSICDMEKRTSAALEGPVEEVRRHLARAPVVHADETSWRMAKRKAWLWLVATSEVAFFTINKSRGGEVIRGILGTDYKGVVVVDRWSAYTRMKRAFCWAHLLRDFTAMHERHHSEWHGVRLENAARQVLRIYRQWHKGKISRAKMKRQIQPLREQIDTTLKWASENAPTSKARALAREIGRHSDCLWRFLSDKRIPPTNNHGERQIRPPVIFRKLSLGNDSDLGAIFTARALTTVSTLRLQDRDPFDFLVDCIVCYEEGRPMPSLLPAHVQST